MRLIGLCSRRYPLVGDAGIGDLDQALNNVHETIHRELHRTKMENLMKWRHEMGENVRKQRKWILQHGAHLKAQSSQPRGVIVDAPISKEARAEAAAEEWPPLASLASSWARSPWAPKGAAAPHPR